MSVLRGWFPCVGALFVAVFFIFAVHCRMHASPESTLVSVDMSEVAY